jgi:hypothetical protein
MVHLRYDCGYEAPWYAHSLYEGGDTAQSGMPWQRSIWPTTIAIELIVVQRERRYQSANGSTAMELSKWFHLSRTWTASVSFDRVSTCHELPTILDRLLVSDPFHNFATWILVSRFFSCVTSLRIAKTHSTLLPQDQKMRASRG